jgi:hypothetical protein
MDSADSERNSKARGVTETQSDSANKVYKEGWFRLRESYPKNRKKHTVEEIMTLYNFWVEFQRELRRQRDKLKQHPKML